MKLWIRSSSKSLWTLGIVLVAATAFVMAQPPEGPGGRGGPPGGGPGGGGRPPSPVMEALDADHDGVVSADELKNATAALAKLDKNKDGKLTDDEYRPQGGGRPGGGGPPGGEGRPGPGGREGGPGGRGPGGQDMEPNPERMLAHALEFDVDKDGQLSKGELQKFVADFVKRHSGQGGRGGADGPPRGRAGGRPNEGERPERPRRPE